MSTSDLEPQEYLDAWSKLPETLFSWMEKLFYYLVRLCIIAGILSIIWGILVELTDWGNGRRRIITGIILVAVGIAPEIIGVS